MSRSAAIAAAYILAATQGSVMLLGDRVISPREHTLPRSTPHDAERIAKAEAKRARKAAKRAKQLEAKP